mmetsp:Transcript_26081/g.81323  ORF Transcript_26081/g.81323 Transcript_26081/m.81323 type:complete len:618 (+) Transcript_26081:45-1898(+)
MRSVDWDSGKQLWEVVGGAQKGGILVRTGEATTSQEHGRRLSHGAWVWEEKLQGQRLLYRLLSGEGPETGWVSLRLNQQDLLVRRRGLPPGVGLQEEDASAPGAAAAAARASAPSPAHDHANSHALHQQEIMASTFGSLRLPWAGAAAAPVCRAWCSFFCDFAPAWAKVALGGAGEVPSLCKLLRRAGPRLRVLNVCRARGHGLGAMPEFGAALRSCPDLEDLNVAGWDELSFTRPADLLPTLARSLKSLNIRGCSALHAQLPAMLGSKLKRLEAGWLSESDPERVFKEWTGIFPEHIFRTISGRCPNLVVVRFPGYALHCGQPEQVVVQRLLPNYADIGGVGSLRGLLRLDLSCAQLLEDPAIVRISGGCKRLRSLCLRCCVNVSDRGLQAVADNLGSSLAHINISCCQFSERVVRRLIIRCRGLLSLDLCYCKGLSRNLVGYLCADPALCPQLTMIGAGGLDISDAEVEAMCRKYTGTLEHLGMGKAVVTDMGLLHLAGLPHLRRLSAHQLSRVSAAGLTELCLRAPCLTDVDAEECEYTPTPGPQELEALLKCLEERPYDYDLCEESDDEEAEEARRRREREQERRRRRERADRDAARSPNLLLAMELEMQSPA